MSNAKLFVGNLSCNTTENDLQDAFAAHGTVVEAKPWHAPPQTAAKN